MVTLCLSNGVPMFTAGDERGRTQGGNNNPYVQDNEISWVDWRADDAWLDVYEVTKAALRLRREHPALRQRHWFEGRPTIEGGPKDLVWLHPSGREMAGDDWARRRAQQSSGCSSPVTRCAPPARAASSSGTARSCSGSTPSRTPVDGHVPRRALAATPARSCVSTCPGHPVGATVEAGGSLTLDGRTVSGAAGALSPGASRGEAIRTEPRRTT